MPDTNLQVLLKSRPSGEPTLGNFELVERPMPVPQDGQVLTRTIFLSLDPYMRGRMNAGRSYAEPVKVGGVMCGGTVGRVVDSRHPGLSAGDFVLGSAGWQAYGLERGETLRKLDPAQAPLSWSLGVLGMPGMTAYVGVKDTCRVKAGETFVVSSAAGAVGAVAGQIARVLGAKRVVGTAGSEEKCRYVVGELGFDACLNYKTADLMRDLRQSCPEGIDAYFDNVGGAMLEAVCRQINVGARIASVGAISQYNATQLPAGPNPIVLLVKRATMQGMMVSDHADRQEAFLADVSAWLKAGRVKHREHIVEGLREAPAAFLGLFRGENFGKLLVRVSP